MRILVLEDSQISSEWLNEVLKHMGHKVTQVNSIASALEYEAEDFDVVVADYFLGEKERGVDLAKLWIGKIRFVFFTGVGDIKVVASLSSYGQIILKDVGADVSHAIERFTECLNHAQAEIDSLNRCEIHSHGHSNMTVNVSEHN